MSYTQAQKNEILDKYHQGIKSLYETKATKELSFRTPLENLPKALKPSPIYTIIQEAKSKKLENTQAESLINPDFDVLKIIDKEDELSYNRLIGFVECKDIAKDLDTQSEQIRRYLEISPNIILTNYRRFILLSFGRVIYDVGLFDENLDTRLLTQDNKDKFFTLISAFFADTSTHIKSKDELVKVLSSQSFYLSIALKNAYDDKEDITLFHEFWDRTYETFKAIQKIDFSELDFCDTIAQSIVYGLFVSFVENEQIEIDKIDTHTFIKLLPSHFKTLHEFIYFSIPAFAIPKRILYVLNNVKITLSLLDRASMAKFLNLEIEKIAIYLYEDFLKEYDELRDTQKRKQGGVFYMPTPVVDMIVSSLDELLQRKFDKPKGFLDSEVKVLDFATGTGSFLVGVFEKIISKEREAFRHDTIKHKFLRDIYGFELSFVAYIVARLKLGQILKNAGFSDFSDSDFCIYLNNTLDLSEYANFTMTMPLLNLDREWKNARDVKHNKNLLVILGNPPYNVKSTNKGGKILELLQDYKKGLNEINIQPLDDDYVKFMRFAQWKLVEQGQSQGLFDSANKGLLGFITNNSFLDGRTHRKMRESLFYAFDENYILNLHGDRQDTKDENVFDIRVGVCISLFAKYSDNNGEKKGARMRYFSTQENGILKRGDKFALLNSVAQNGLESIAWSELEIEKPYFWFVKKTFDSNEYKEFWALASDRALGEKKAIFEVCNSRIKTQKDEVATQLTKKDMQNVLEDFITLDEKMLATKYKIHDSRDWTISKAKAEVIANVDCFDLASAKSCNDKVGDSSLRGSKASVAIQNKIQKIAYRPFDIRYTFTSGKTKGFVAYPRTDTMKYFLISENLGICFAKDCEQMAFDNAIISDKLADIHYGGGQTYIAPLYCFVDSQNEVGKIQKIPNFTKEFSAFIATHKVLKNKTPEQILAFIYGNLYNPTYRTKYAEYLKIGFPRIDFDISESKFESMANLGQKLIDLHLMQNLTNSDFAKKDFADLSARFDFASIDFEGEFDSSLPIDSLTPKQRYEKGKIKLNKNLSLKGIYEEIWSYKIGGYEVLKQWLKFRKDYLPSKDELEHLLLVVKVIKATICLQKELGKIPTKTAKDDNEKK